MKDMKCMNCGALLHMQEELDRVQCPACSFVNRLHAVYTNPKMADGKLPYIFVSYCHKDMDTVVPVIQAMQQCGYRVWYDKYMEHEEEWPAFVQNMEKGCRVFVCFISDSYIDSEHCRDEVNLAKSNQKNMLILEIQENVEYRNGMELQIGSRQKVQVFDYKDLYALMVKLNGIEMLQECRNTGAGNPQSLNSLQDKPVINTQKENKRGGRKVLRRLFAFICVIAVIFGVVSLSNKEDADELPSENNATVADATEKATDDAITTTEAESQSDIATQVASESTEVATQAPTTQSTEPIEKNFMDECAAYEYENCKTASDSKTFTMAGKKYTSGIFQNNSSNGRFISNLEGKYTELRFIAGHIDGTKMCDYTVKITLDNVVIHEFEVKALDLPKEISIPVTGGQQLIVSWQSSHTDYSDGCRIGFANMTVVQGTETVAAQQTVKNPADKNFMDECAAYEYENCKTASDSKTFTMAGKKYTSGIFQNNSSNGRFISNLEGKYTELRFIAGHIDGTKMCDYTVKITLDNVVIHEFEVKALDLPKEISIPVTGGQQLIVSWQSSHTDYSDGCRIGFADMTVS